MRSIIKRIWGLVRSNLILLIREPYFIFFDLVFAPAAFLFFVTVMGASPAEFVFHLYVDAPTGRPLIEESAAELGSFRLHFVPADVSDPAEWTLDDALKTRRDPVLLALPPNWENDAKSGNDIPVRVYASADNPNTYLVSLLMEKIAQSMGVAPAQKTPFSLETIGLEAVEKPTIDRVALQTLLIMWLIVGGMHAVSQYAFLVESGMSKRLLATPLRKVELIIALLTEALTALLIVSLIVILMAKVMYHATLLDTPRNLLYILAGEIAMVTLSATLGLFIAAILKEPARMTWGPLSIYMLLMFLSGLTLPIGLFPDTLRNIAEWLPTRRLIMAMEAGLLYNRPGWPFMIYPVLVSLFFFIGTVLLMPWRETRRG